MTTPDKSRYLRRHGEERFPVELDDDADWHDGYTTSPSLNTIIATVIVMGVLALVLVLAARYGG